MKKHTKFLTLFLALAMLLAFALPVTVSAASGDGKITIKPPAGFSLENALPFYAYKLYNVDSITPGDDPGEFSVVYSATTALKDFLVELEDAGADLEADYGMETSPNADPELAADEFRAWLQATAIEDDIIELAKLLVNSTAFSSGSIAGTLDSSTPKNVVFDNLVYGYYLVTGNVVPEMPSSVKKIGFGKWLSIAYFPNIFFWLTMLLLSSSFSLSLSSLDRRE